MDNKTIQKHIFEYLLAATGKCQAVLVEEICQLFNCSKSSVYKRWRGDQPLIHPDIALLKQEYDIPTEVIFPDKNITPPIIKTICFKINKNRHAKTNSPVDFYFDWHLFRLKKSLLS
jgi:hypothetical protein